jgi:hypothetical protein
MTARITNIKAPGQRIILAIALILSLSAFRHTDVEGHVDPNFTGYEFSTVVVRMPNASLSFRKLVTARLQKQFRKRNIRMIMHNDLFPPTRQWTDAQIQETYERHNVDAGLIITIGSDRTEQSPGFIMFDSTTIGDHTYMNATHVSVVRDFTSFEISLVDAESRQTAWLGRLDTRGAGVLFVGNKSTAKGLVKGLFKEWKRSGIVKR